MNRRQLLIAGAGTASGAGALYWVLNRDEDGGGFNPIGPEPTATPLPRGTMTPQEGTGDETPTPYDESPTSETFGLSAVTDFSMSEVTVELNSDHITNSYPEGGVIGITLLRENSNPNDSSVVGTKQVDVPTSGTQTETVDVDIGEQTQQEPFYFIAILFDDRYRDGTNDTLLSMSDRFIVDGRELVAKTHPSMYVGEVNAGDSDASYIRYDLPGRYVVVISGTTHDRDWRLTAPIFKYRYNSREHQSGDIGSLDTALRNSFVESGEGWGRYPVNTFVNSYRDVLQQVEFSPKERFEFYAAIVRSLEKSPDYQSGYNRYLQYPLETIVRGGGDVEDVALLLAGMCLKDSDAVPTSMMYMTPAGDNHAAVGLSGDFSGFSKTINNTEYHYLDPTTAGGAIGVAPRDAHDKPFEIAALEAFE